MKNLKMTLFLKLHYARQQEIIWVIEHEYDTCLPNFLEVGQILYHIFLYKFTFMKARMQLL